MKRIFKGPWLWIVLSAFAVLLAIQFLAPSDGYDEVNTSTLASYIDDGKVDEITFIDGDQEIQATLDKGTRSDGDKVVAYYIQ
ncbi:MAG TPA: ATP-dependent metallopeptidase FtsH/Yme1/Tma family protein, partial [Nocardioides sp.]